jgi:hypothetical protein
MDRYKALLESELSDFIAQATTPDRDARVSASDIYDAYVAWSSRGTSPVPPMTSTMFGRLAPGKLFRHRSGPGQFYLGVRLK